MYSNLLKTYFKVLEDHFNTLNYKKGNNLRRKNEIFKSPQTLNDF